MKKSIRSRSSAPVEPCASGSPGQGVTTRSVALPERQKFLNPRKPRSDSTLDSRLSAAQGDDLFQRLEHGLSLHAAATELQETFGIRLSCASISRWAARRRRARHEITLASLVHTVQEDQEMARTLGGPGRSPAALLQANETFLSHALFTAFVHRDQGAIRQAAKMFADHTNALTRKRRMAV